MRSMRSRKERRMDSQAHYNGLEKAKTSAKAKEDFKRPVFSTRKVVESPEE